MFIEIKDKYEESVLLNIDNISAIHYEQKRVLMNGVHGEGTGFYDLPDADFEHLLGVIIALRSVHS